MLQAYAVVGRSTTIRGALMANNKHVALLKKGVDARNAWRKENPDIHPGLSGAGLSGANLHLASLDRATLSGANLRLADLSGAILSEANLNEAELTGADLQASTLMKTDFTAADLSGCHVYGVSAWGLKLDGTKQQNLVITDTDEPEITVDNIEVAQFVTLSAPSLPRRC